MDLALTVAEAAPLLNPAMSEDQLRQIIHALGWQPTGQKRTGKPGHPQPTYHAGEIIALHGALAPFLRPRGLRGIDAKPAATCENGIHAHHSARSSRHPHAGRE